MLSNPAVPNKTGFATSFDSLRKDASGSAQLLVHQQYGAIALPTNPSNTQTLTLTINGTAITITFVTSIGTTPGNVLIGSSAAATAANLLGLLQNPQTTSSTQVALSAANQQLVSYLTWSLVSSGTTITAGASNLSIYTWVTSFTASTTVTGGSYTAQTMQLYVEPGVVWVNGTRVVFNGGSTPTVTAPTTHPRIDVLTIDNTGTLAWTTGVEAASPSVPAYPTDKITLCELYNVVGETALYDNANQQTNDGYIYNDIRPIIGQTTNWGAFVDSIIPASPSAIDLGSAGNPFRNIYGNGSNITGLNTSRIVQSFTAGGTINASTTPQAVYLKSSDGKVYVADVAADESTYKFIGFVGDGQNVLANASVNVTISGYLSGFSGLTSDSYYYLGTAGAISTTPDGTRPKRCALATSTTAIIIVFGQNVKNVSDSLASGTGTTTHAVTVGFRPKLITGICEGGNSGGTTGTSSFFSANELGQQCVISKGNSGDIGSHTSIIGRENDANNASWDISVGSFTDTGFSITYNRAASTWTTGGSVSACVIGE